MKWLENCIQHCSVNCLKGGIATLQRQQTCSLLGQIVGSRGWVPPCCNKWAKVWRWEDQFEASALPILDDQIYWTEFNSGFVVSIPVWHTRGGLDWVGQGGSSEGISCESTKAYGEVSMSSGENHWIDRPSPPGSRIAMQSPPLGSGLASALLLHLPYSIPCVPQTSPSLLILPFSSPPPLLFCYPQFSCVLPHSTLNALLISPHRISKCPILLPRFNLFLSCMQWMLSILGRAELVGVVGTPVGR